MSDPTPDYEHVNSDSEFRDIVEQSLAFAFLRDEPDLYDDIVPDVATQKTMKNDQRAIEAAKVPYRAAASALHRAGYREVIRMVNHQISECLEVHMRSDGATVALFNNGSNGPILRLYGTTLEELGISALPHEEPRNLHGVISSFRGAGWDSSLQHELMVFVRGSRACAIRFESLHGSAQVCKVWNAPKDVPGLEWIAKFE